MTSSMLSSSAMSTRQSVYTSIGPAVDGNGSRGIINLSGYHAWMFFACMDVITRHACLVSCRSFVHRSAAQHRQRQQDMFRY